MNEKFEAAEEAVKIVESKLAALDSKLLSYSDLQANIDQLKTERADLLASNLEEKKRISALAKVDLTSEVRQAELAKLTSVIGEAKKLVVAEAITAHNVVTQLRDALVVAAKTEVRNILLSVFPERVLKLLEAHINYASKVKALDISFLLFGPKEDVNLEIARLYRPETQSQPW